MYNKNIYKMMGWLVASCVWVSFVYPVARVDHHYRGAFILLYFKENNEINFILGREHMGRNKGTWSLPGGSIDKLDGKNPMVTAAREFFEEFLIADTLGISINHVIRYLEHHYADDKGAKEPITMDKTIIFLVPISIKAAKKLLKSFDGALRKISQCARNGNRADFIKYLEMDSLAVVASSDIPSNLSINNRELPAKVYGKNKAMINTAITLRPMAVRVLKRAPWFVDKGHHQLLNVK